MPNKPHHTSRQRTKHKDGRNVWDRLHCIFIPWFLLGGTFLLIFFLLLSGRKMKPFEDLDIARASLPKVLTLSSVPLPQNIQLPIEELAKQQIREEQASSLLTTNTATSSLGSSLSNSGQTITSTSTSQVSSQTGISVIQPFIDTIQEAISTDPVDKAKLRLKKIDRIIQKTQTLLQNDKSDKAVDRATTLIQIIGEETAKVAADGNVQTDREVLTQQIVQYNKLQLIIQKLEEAFPINGYLKIDEARVKYLVSGAQQSLNVAPNLDLVHTVAVGEIKKLVGADYAELKAIEILTDIGSGVNPKTKQKLSGLEKQLALQFEKRMLKLPQEVRTRKLQNYITYSYGNPLKQAEAFEQMKNFLTDREMILGVDALKEAAIQKLEDRVFQIKDQNTLNQFLESSFKDSSALKILTQLKLDVLAGKDEARKKQIVALEEQSNEKVIETFGKDKDLAAYFSKDATTTADILDVTTISQLANTLNKSPNVSADVKKTIGRIKQKALQDFVSTLAKRDFVSQPKRGYNPVGKAADVRLLLVDPQVIPLLEDIKNELPEKDKSTISIAQKSAATLIADHVLLEINDPEAFQEHQALIVDNPQLKDLIQKHIGRSFFTTLDKKGKLLDKQAKADQQKLYEKAQQIVQQVFVTRGKTDLESQLPTEIQQQITKLKGELPNRNIPKLKTPSGITLSQVATLPTSVQNAIIEKAREKISETTQTKLDLEKQAKDLGVAIPTILPDNPLYFIVKVTRVISLLTKTDPVDRAEELLKQDNEKVLEAAKLIETNPSQKAVALATDTLKSVADDFNTLKDHVSELTSVEKIEPQKVEELINTMIDDGLSRQTVLSQIENAVHGDDYIAVEKLRTDMVKDGVDLLLEVTHHNVEKLTQKLEETVKSEQNNPLEGIKAVELLNEIARTEPENIQQVLETAESTISTIVETKILAIPEEKRIQEVLNYAENQTGNPVRQLEAYDILKDNFDNPQVILLTEGLKDKATENLIERISEIPDEATRTEFADTIIGALPQDLKAIIEIEARVEPPQNAGAIETLPIVGQVENIKAEIEQNIIDAYKDNPQALAQTDFYDNPTTAKTPDAADLQVAQELTKVLEQTPEVIPEVVALVKSEEEKIINTFVENVSQAQVQVTASASAKTSVSTLTAQTLDPLPDTLVALVDLKEELPPASQAKIDIAIEAQVNLIQDHLVNTVTDPATFQAYVAQIEENPVAAAVVAQVGGSNFTQAVQEKAQEVATTASQEETQLQTIVTQVQQEVFSNSTSVSAPVIQTLPQPVQEQIQEIKQEVPAAQIPIVNVEVQAAQTTTVTVTEPAPQAPAPQAPAPQESTPAPAAPAPEAPKPAEQSAPPPEAPQAPAVPGL